jgi:plasmid stabilization system protein ParE
VAKPRFHPEAAAEFSAAIAWYRQRSHRTADRFEEEIEQVLRRIEDDPQLFARYDDIHRFAVVKRFPFCVVYRMLGEILYVVAVAHSSRAPGYWRERSPR